MSLKKTIEQDVIVLKDQDNGPVFSPELNYKYTAWSIMFNFGGAKNISNGDPIGSYSDSFFPDTDFTRECYEDLLSTGINLTKSSDPSEEMYYGWGGTFCEESPKISLMEGYIVAGSGNKYYWAMELTDLIGGRYGTFGTLIQVIVNSNVTFSQGLEKIKERYGF